MTDIIEDLDNLVAAAVTERSHYYVAKTAIKAGMEIKRLREEISIKDRIIGKVLDG